jgi:hypothetical protein
MIMRKNHFGWAGSNFPVKLRRRRWRTLLETRQNRRIAGRRTREAPQVDGSMGGILRTTTLTCDIRADVQRDICGKDAACVE